HISYGSPLQYTKEYLVSLRKLLAGKKVTLEGEGVNMTNAQLHFVPLRSEIPILLAAMGPKMLNLAAEYGDGAMLNSCTSVKQAKHSAEIVSSSSRGSTKKELVDDRIVDALTVCGPVEDCRRRIRDYHDVGVTTAVVNPMTSKTFAKSEELVG